MKKFLAILVLGLFLITPSWADDIRDFQIEGMSIGDSLLDYFSEEKIKQNERKTTYKNKKFVKYGFVESTFNTYESLKIYLKTNDKKYIVKSISGLFIIDNINECLEKRDSIAKEIDFLFFNVLLQ